MSSINLMQTLKNKFENLLKKSIEAEKKLDAKKLEIIKQSFPDFEGSTQDFFRMHTLVCESINNNQKKHYDTISGKFVNYDEIVDGTIKIGIIYDDVAKDIYLKSKRTKEYIICEYYEKVFGNFITILNNLYQNDEKEFLYELYPNEEKKVADDDIRTRNMR